MTHPSVVGTTTKLASGASAAKPVPKPTPKPTATPTPKPTPTAGPSPIPSAPAPALPNLTGTDQVWHLLRRATFGPTPALVAEVKTLGATAWLDQQLSPATINDSACDAYLSRYPTLPMTTPQIRAAIPQFGWDAMFELGRATLARALFSRRQLLEVMVEFWSNHFNIANPER